MANQDLPAAEMSGAESAVVPGTGAVTSVATRYSRVAMTLHWLTALAMVIQLGLGWGMSSRSASGFALFQLHKSIGITILVLTLARLAWRVAVPPPPLATTLRPAERLAARVVHVAFYALLLGLPVTGWLLVSSSTRAIPTYLYGIIPWPHLPGVAGLAPSAKASVSAASGTGHELLVYLVCLAIALHVAGAIKHHWLDRDDELGRMIPLPRRAAGVAAATAMLLGLGLGGWALTGGLGPIAARLVHKAPAPATDAPPLVAEVATPAPPAPEAASQAVPEPTPTPTSTPATEEAKGPSVWTVRRASSSLRFGMQWSQGTLAGRFAKWDADIVFSPDALADSRVSVVIDMASVATNSDDSQSALPGDEWFATAAHPTARFVATRFDHVGGDRYAARGTLTLRGKTRPLTLPFTLKINGDVATMQATTRIDRTAFGVGQGEWAATDDIPANIAVTIAIQADRKTGGGK